VLAISHEERVGRLCLVGRNFLWGNEIFRNWITVEVAYLCEGIKSPALFTLNGSSSNNEKTKVTEG
jgi:hypothetical protein